jgi:hypothetical protein
MAERRASLLGLAGGALMVTSLPGGWPIPLLSWVASVLAVLALLFAWARPAWAWLPASVWLVLVTLLFAGLPESRWLALSGGTCVLFASVRSARPQTDVSAFE